jgi:hypothetical protein
VALQTEPEFCAVSEAPAKPHGYIGGNRAAAI